jgi:hypothetical protein
MTARRRPARRTRRRARGWRSPLGVLALAAVAVLALDLLAHWWVLALVAALAAGYWLGRRQGGGPIAWPWSRPARVPLGAVLAAADARDADEVARLRDEVDRLAAEAEQLMTERDEARESAALAWDASASAPPRPAPPPGDGRARLLAAPRSGARPLGGGAPE